MGGMEGMMGMMPGMKKMSKQVEAAGGMDDKIFKRQIALIQSMTKKERANPDILAASRKKRIAKGAGLEVSELNKLIKQHRQMADMMKKMGKMGKGGMLTSPWSQRVRQKEMIASSVHKYLRRRRTKNGVARKRVLWIAR